MPIFMLQCNASFMILKEEAESVTPTKEACPNELSHHLATVHGGWYADGVLFQIVKTVTQVRHNHTQN